MKRVREDLRKGLDQLGQIAFEKLFVEVVQVKLCHGVLLPAPLPSVFVLFYQQIAFEKLFVEVVQVKLCHWVLLPAPLPSVFVPLY
jgi:hypothetical protein